VDLAAAAAQVQDAGHIPQPGAHNEGPLVLRVRPITHPALPCPPAAPAAATTATTAAASHSCRAAQLLLVEVQRRLQVYAAALPLLLQACLHSPGRSAVALSCCAR
jgi:hypothetical protein